MIAIHCRWVAAVVAGASLLAAVVPSASAAETYKAGDEIEVLFLGDWRPATVVDVNKRGDVLAEFEFAGGNKREAFAPANVRAKFESGAITRARLWTDTTGKFKVKAALIKMTETTITLRKPDLSEVPVAIEKLCDLDKKYIKDLQRAGGAKVMAGPEPPQIEQFAASGIWGGLDGDPPVPYQPDPIPAYKRLKQGGYGFPSEGFFERIGAVLPVGGPESWVLAGVEDETPAQPTPSRLVWVSLTEQKLKSRQLLPPGEVVLDYHPPSHRLLTFASLRSKEDPWGEPMLTLWEVLPTDKEVKPVVRWNVRAPEYRPGFEPWARLINGNLVVQRYEDDEYVVWNAEKKEMVWRTKQESFFKPDAVLSGGGNFLFLPEDKGVRVLEAASGKFVAMLAAKDGASGVAVSEDGRRAAVLGRSTLTVWDLADLKAEPQHYQAEAIGTPFTASLAWQGDDRIMVGQHRSQVMYSLKLKVVLWRYDFDHQSNPSLAFRGRRLCEIVDSHLVYTAMVHDRQNILAVGAVKLPGPRVDEVAATIDPASLMIIKRGSEVRLDVRAGDYTQRVTDALETHAQENGWKISPNASIVITAEMRRGQTQTTTYQQRQTGQTQSVTVTPYISEVKIVVNNLVAWNAATSSGGAPLFVSLREGQSLQAEIDRWQVPNPDFFDTLTMPESILDPAKKNGFGVTKVTTKGLEPTGDKP